jgi:hypothetical protein
MPGLDKTGPLGQGSKTGRKMGNCNPGEEPGAGSFFPRRWFAARAEKTGSRNLTGGGFGPGRGPGRGLGRLWGKQG